MADIERLEKISSPEEDDDDLYEPLKFDPEQTSGDDEIDSDLLAFRDAVRDIWASEGSFELFIP